ncbi:PAS domain-containing protein [Skermanella mucosa]|uniref:PAS domain-containing protein n=1 Tax=Skermanella mucosa TaxID=1789672 RepID=UPI00192BEB4F|nr:PAS domain-containing protein [Skermanella mucosa]UEM21254.1 PAS domain-containing protein [Skermanella mucosa]
MNDSSEVDFDMPDLAGAIERLSGSEVDALSFGAIRLDAKGDVTFYSAAEARLSGYGTRPALGRSFFTDMAPCMDDKEFRGRIDHARAAGKYNLEFGWIGDFADRARELQVRIQPASDGGCWIFIRRD